MIPCFFFLSVSQTTNHWYIWYTIVILSVSNSAKNIYYTHHMIEKYKHDHSHNHLKYLDNYDINDLYNVSMNSYIKV